MGSYWYNLNSTQWNALAGELRAYPPVDGETESSLTNRLTVAAGYKIGSLAPETVLLALKSFAPKFCIDAKGYLRMASLFTEGSNARE